MKRQEILNLNSIIYINSKTNNLFKYNISKITLIKNYFKL